jgi:hypothetical protein
MIAILHWAGTLLWLTIRGIVVLLMMVNVAALIVGCCIFLIGPILAPLFKEQSSFKRAKGQSKGPINPYANTPSEPKT